MPSDRTLPRTVLRGEELYVEGESAPYLRDTERSIKFDVGSLEIFDGYQADDLISGDAPKVPVRMAINGYATILDGDSLKLIGTEVDKGVRIHFGLHPVAAEQETHHWKAVIGFNMADFEFNMDEQFYVSCYCPIEAFSHILQAVRGGRVKTLNLTLSTTLWTKEKSSGWFHTKATMYLAPSNGSSDSYHQERGGIVSLTWREQY